MRKVILYTAASLDGLIAKKDGSVDWLFNDEDYEYEAFINPNISGLFFLCFVSIWEHESLPDSTAIIFGS